jgi:hypothetical protein
VDLWASALQESEMELIIPLTFMLVFFALGAWGESAALNALNDGEKSTDMDLVREFLEENEIPFEESANEMGKVPYLFVNFDKDGKAIPPQ